MELKEGILARKSVRGFKPDPVSKETIEKVLTLAQRAVSAMNGQPWEFVVLTGDTMKIIAEENMKDLDEKVEPDIKDPALVDEYKARSVGLAKQLFGVMEIERHDIEKRNWWVRRGYRFFDAPAVILICRDERCDEKGAAFDIGAVTQNVCLAALEYGLGTCTELQAVNYQRGLRKHLNLPESKHFVVGIAIGYPDDSFPANNVVSERAPLEEVTSWYGFE